jgi:acetyl-CoA acetyltransferase
MTGIVIVAAGRTAVGTFNCTRAQIPAAELKRDARKGLASVCIGGGMGVALAVKR